MTGRCKKIPLLNQGNKFQPKAPGRCFDPDADISNATGNMCGDRHVCELACFVAPHTSRVNTFVLDHAVNQTTSTGTFLPVYEPQSVAGQVGNVCNAKRIARLNDQTRLAGRQINQTVSLGIECRSAYAQQARLE